MQRATTAFLVATMVALGASQMDDNVVVDHLDTLPRHPLDETPLTEAICLSDNSKEAKCYQESEPVAYNKARAVLRIIKNAGTTRRAHCTGWLIGSEGHIMTNHHCVDSQAGADSLIFEVMGEGPDCETDCRTGLACPGVEEVTGAEFITADSDFDYALLRLPEAKRNLTKTLGYFQMRHSGSVEGERIYIAQHPAGWGKRLAIEVDGSNATHPKYATITSAPDVTNACSRWSVKHNADTQGGSSGSPVISWDDQTVVALHNCGGCSTTRGGSNNAVPGRLVVKHLGDLMPKDGVAGAPNAPSTKYCKSTAATTTDDWCQANCNGAGGELHPACNPASGVHAQCECAAECAPGCPDSSRGDGFCDDACNNAACKTDDGDCEGTCAPGCPADRLADNRCDLGCNTTECNMDNLACAPICAPGCKYTWPGDNYCDAACMTPECNWDGGDCPATCDDGIQNGDETDRDCGGSCPACGNNCPFHDTTDHPDMLGCADGTQCNKTALGWGCCVDGHGGRAMCPPTNPWMCGTPNVCGGGRDYCCSISRTGCTDGLRLCRKDDNTTHID